MRKKLKEKFIVIVYGPTGVGKSGFAEKLASQLPAQLVNCDIGQFYTPFGIGTAKPLDWKTSPIKQHLFDIIDTPKNFNVCEYRKLLFDTVEKIWAENQLPVLVGGSGFYLKSLFYPPACPDVVQKNKTFELPQGVRDIDLWDYLYKVDPKRAKQLDKTDIYRIKRALDVWVQTRQRPSDLVPVYNFPCNFLIVFLSRDRKQMYERIDKRLNQMMHEGWPQEVEGLMGTEWENFLKEKKLIGYDLLIDYFNASKSCQDFEKVIRIISKKTKGYAKKQETFWRSFREKLQKSLDEIEQKDIIVSSKIDTINLTLLDLDLYIKQLLDYLNPLFE